MRERHVAGIPILSEEQGQTLDKTSTRGDDIPYLSKEKEAQLDNLQEKVRESLSAMEISALFFSTDSSDTVIFPDSSIA